MGLKYTTCAGADECSRQIAAGAGALLLTEEALESPLLSNLLEVLKAQPAWSELPLVILTSGGESRRARFLDLVAAGRPEVLLCLRTADQHPFTRPVNAGCITFSATPVPGARSPHPTQELERNARAPRRRTHSPRLSNRRRDSASSRAELSLAEEAERRRIAEMLHEDLQQLLLTARMRLAALCRTRDAAQREPIASEIANILERSFQLTRSLSVELAPPVLHERGLSRSIRVARG